MRFFSLFALIVPLMLLASPTAAQADDVYHLVRVKAVTETEVRNIASLGLDIVQVMPEGELEAVVTESDISELRDMGFSVDIRINDMASYYKERLVVPEGQRAFPDGSMGGNYTLSEIEDMLDDWAVQYPDLITAKQSIGQSIQGRDIWAVKISDNANVDEDEPEVLFDALIHAREPQSMMTLIYYMMHLLDDYGTDPELTYLVNNREIWFIPVHNPDGYYYNEQNSPSGGGMWRKNRRNNGDGTYGVDLNRNYGYKWGYNNTGSSPYTNDDTYRGTAAFSEPETQAVRDFILSRPIVTSWNTHTYSNLYLCPYGYDYVYPDPGDWAIYQDYLDEISQFNGYTTGPISYVLYDANGGSTDWQYAEAGVYNITPEIGGSGDGFWPSFNRILPLAEENFMPIKFWTWIAGSYIMLDDYALNDDNGDTYIHPGEPVEVVLTLRNRGLSDTLSNVVATIASSSPYVTIDSDIFNFGTIAAQTSEDNGAEPLGVTISSDAPYGETITLDVEISFDNHALFLPITLICGVPSIAIEDDFETNQGWTVQNTSISTGEFERANPAGTDAQPEDDHSATGTMCYVTGAAGGSAGNDDLDGGPTRLLSPTFDLSAGDATVSFWYFFYHSDYGAQHPLDIHISNNNGVSWTLVDELTHKPVWTHMDFVVSDYVTPTAQMMVRFSATDNPNDDLVEALIDDFQVLAYTSPLSLTYTGTPELLSTVTFVLDAPTDAGLGYFMAASLSTYPVLPVGDRWFPLGWDYILLPFSINPGNGVFNNFVGYLDGAGHSEDAQFAIPNMPILVGKSIYFAAATLDAGYPDGVKNFSAPLPLVVQ